MLYTEKSKPKLVTLEGTAMKTNLKSFGASLDGKELHILPNYKSLVIRDENYGYTTVIPTVTEAGRHTLAVCHYGSNKETNQIIESALKDVSHEIGKTYIRDADYIKVSAFKPALRTQESLHRIKEILLGAGFGESLDSRSVQEVVTEDAISLDVPIKSNKPIAETTLRGLRSQDEAVLMSLKLTCEGTKAISFDIHNMLNGKDHVGYPLPFVISRLSMESHESEDLQNVAREILDGRFGSNLVRCTVQPEDGYSVLEYAVLVSSDAMKMLSEQVYPIFKSDPQHNCLRVVELRTKEVVDGAVLEGLEAAITASGVGVNFELLEGGMGIRIAIPSYDRLPANESSDLEQRVTFVSGFLDALSVSEPKLHETIAFNSETVKTVQKSNGEYVRVSCFESKDFAYARTVSTKDLQHTLSEGRLGASMSGTWYFESHVDGHVLALTQDASDKVTVGYFIKKGVLENKEAARADAKSLLALV